MADIFVSYSSKDVDRIQALVEELEQTGLSVWWDRHIETGTEFDREIEKALDEARCIVTVWSAHSVDSDWVRTESTEGMDRKILVPIKIDDVKPPLAFRRLQTTDLIGFPGYRNELELSRMLNSVQSILKNPKSFAPAAFTSRSSRRNLTILRTRIDGLSVTPHLDLEEIEDSLTQIKQACRLIIERHGGSVNQFTGTGLMAVFGFPISHEDDPRRTIDAAFELKKLITDSQDWGKHGLTFSAGVSSGLAIASLIDEEADHFELTGLCVDISDHLLTASSNEILICSETMSRVEDFYNVEATDPINVAALPHPIQAYSVNGRSAIQTRMEAREIRGLTPFSGRNQEIALLQQTLRSSAQSGCVFSVIGEAGSGKSRLVREFLNSIGEETTVFRGRCLASAQNVTYFPLIDLLQRSLGLNNVEPAQRHDALITAISNLDEDCGSYIPHCMYLLSIPSSEYQLPEHLQGTAMRYVLEEAMVSLITALTYRSTSVLILEDWHWADKASDSVLSQIIEISAANNFLLIVVHRPDYEPDWHHHSNYQQLKLSLLPRAASDNLIEHILGVTQIPESLGEKIFETTGGNPFFTEEICASLLEEGDLLVENQIVKLQKDLASLSLPSSVEAVIQTRLDNLDSVSRGVLSIAAVIGREFTLKVLEQVSQSTEMLKLALSELIRAGIILQTRAGFEQAYSFKHVLTQLVAYESMLRKQRREIHAQVANSLEILHAEQLQKFAEVLAFHYSKTDVTEKAISYSILAGEKASRSSANHAAITHYTIALELLEALPDSDTDKRRRRDVNLSLSQHLLLTQGYNAPQVYSAFDKARELSKQLGDNRAFFPNLWGLWRFYYNVADFDSAMTCSAEMREIAENLDDARLLSIASTAKAVTLGWMGKLPEAHEYFKKGLENVDINTEIAEAHNYGVLPHIMNLAFYPMTLSAMGLVDTSREVIKKLGEVSASIEHKPTVVLSLFYQFVSLSTLQYHKESMKYLQQLSTMAEKEGFPHWTALSRFNFARAQLGKIDIDKSMAELRATHAEVEKLGVVLTEPTFRIAMSVACGMKGQVADGIDHLDTALGKVPFWDAEIYRFRGDLNRRVDQGSAQHDYLKALEIATELGIRIFQLRSAISLVEIELQQGSADTASNRLLEVYNSITEGHDSATMLAAKKLLQQAGLLN